MYGFRPRTGMRGYAERPEWTILPFHEQDAGGFKTENFSGMVAESECGRPEMAPRATQRTNDLYHVAPRSDRT